MMGVSERVRRDPFSANAEAFGTEYVIDFVCGKWRIYEAWGDYSTTSGGFVVKGRAVRREDCTAPLEIQGSIAKFDTKSDALAYCERWLVVPTTEIHHKHSNHRATAQRRDYDARRKNRASCAANR